MKIGLSMALLLLMVVSRADAEEVPKQVTLPQAIAQALQSNNRIKSAGYLAQASEESRSIAALSYYPSLQFDETLSLSNAPTQTFMMKLDQGRFTQDDFATNRLNHPATQHDFKTSLTIRQPLYDPAVTPQRDLAGYEATQGKLTVTASREAVAFQVFQQYLAIQKGEAQRVAADQGVRDAEEHLRLATVRNAAGTGLKSDQLRAQTELSTRQLQQLSARNSLRLARMRLAMLMGEPNAAEVAITAALKPLDPAADSGQLLVSAREHRSDLQQARLEQQKGDANRRLARSSFLPTVGAFASYQLNSHDLPLGNDNDSWLAGVQLSWQLFDGFKRYHQRDRAEALRSAAGEQLEQANRETALQIQEALLRHDESLKRLEMARHAVADAEETVRLVKKRYENSLATMMELLDAGGMLNQSRSTLADAEAEQILAGGQVYYTAGLFLKEILK